MSNYYSVLSNKQLKNELYKRNIINHSKKSSAFLCKLLHKDDKGNLEYKYFSLKKLKELTAKKNLKFNNKTTRKMLMQKLCGNVGKEEEERRDIFKKEAMKRSICVQNLDADQLQEYIELDIKGELDCKHYTLGKIRDIYFSLDYKVRVGKVINFNIFGPIFETPYMESKSQLLKNIRIHKYDYDVLKLIRNIPSVPLEKIFNLLSVSDLHNVLDCIKLKENFDIVFDTLDYCLIKKDKQCEGESMSLSGLKGIPFVPARN